MSKIFLKGIATKSDNGNYRVLASTNSVDRQGDIVDQAGWDFKNFLKNPSVLWAHKYDELPIAKATKIEVTKAGLEMEFEFASAEGNPKAQQVKTLFDEGFLNAVSVGFIPKERDGNKITKSELLEVSIVPVPANQDALRLAMSKGMNVSDVIADIEKGEVSDILDEAATRQAKYENIDQVYDIVYAFCQAYCDPSVAVDDFSKLLLESIGLLTQVANGEEVTPPDTDAGDGEGDDMEMAIEGYFMKKLGLEKDGRVLSAKNLKIINTAVESMTASIAALDELAKASSSDEGGGKSSEEVEGAEVKTIVFSEDEFATTLRQILRANDRGNEVALGLVGKLLEGKQAK